MSDYLKRTFRAHLTSTMDSFLRKAVFEIMTIFENSIHDHQMELAHKGEEVVQLKIKLQSAELRLQKFERGGEGAVEINKTHVNETQRQPDTAQNISSQTSDVPEIDVEVPDDWCAPLGCETVNKKDEGMCPSVRLRQLSIPLWQIPVKQEVGTYRIDRQQQIRNVRRSTRGSSSNTKHITTRMPSVRSDKKFLQEIKQEVLGGLVLRKGRTVIGKGQENTGKTGKGRKTTDIKCTQSTMEKSDGEKTYRCKFCEKVFNTPFGRAVHIRTHRRCQGCKKEFPCPSALKCHKSACEKPKKLLAKRAQLANTQISDSKEKIALLSYKNVSARQEHLTDSNRHSQLSVKNDAFKKMHHCTYCNKKFRMRRRLKQHMALHTHDKMFNCSSCPKKFHIIKALRSHITKMHKDQMHSSETKRDLAWTKDNQDESISSSTKIPNSVQKVKKESIGLQNYDGFSCTFCQKCMKTKRQLVEHVRLHTGEKPLKCNKCPGKFRTCGQLYQHKKQGCSRSLIQCKKCLEQFSSQASCDKHVPLCQKKCPYICRDCGKGFFYQGSLENHMSRVHC